MPNDYTPSRVLSESVIIFNLKDASIILLFITATHHSTVVLHYDYLKDLDNRYHPRRLIGTVQYCPNVMAGLHNRYTSLHPYIFFSAFLDPRMKGNLSKYFLNDDDYNQLRNDILAEMVEVSKLYLIYI